MRYRGGYVKQIIPVKFHWELVGTIGLRPLFYGGQPTQVAVKGGSTEPNFLKFL